MPVEIERKFLVADASWREAADEGTAIRQCYLVAEDHANLRVRIKRDRDAVLTLKFGVSGLKRHEFEYDVPLDDAEAMIEASSGALVEKVRYRVPYGGMVWEVDVFRGRNEGLTVAEVELESEDQPFERPPWLGGEVTDDPRYLNINLAQHAFRTWPTGPAGRE